MILKAVDIREFDFTGYGTYYNMTGDRERVYRTLGEEFEDYMTRTPLIDTPGHLGYTVGMGAPYVLKAMEKHDHTQEALFCAADPVILCVAKAREDEPPLAEDVRALILNPGDVAVLDRNIWHDACHGIGKRTAYYYLASQGPAPALWVRVAGGRVLVQCSGRLKQTPGQDNPVPGRNTHS